MGYHLSQLALDVATRPKVARMQIRFSLNQHTTIAAAATALGVSTKSLHRYMLKLKIKSGKARGGDRRSAEARA